MEEEIELYAEGERYLHRQIWKSGYESIQSSGLD